MPREDWVIIGVIGARTRDSLEDEELVFEAIKKLWVKDKTIICSGGCSTGGDRFAKLIAYLHQLPYLEFPAEWNRKGKSAGFARNGTIAEWSDYLVACVSESRKGGTEDTIQKFCDMGKEKNLIIV